MILDMVSEDDSRILQQVMAATPRNYCRLIHSHLLYASNEKK